MELPNCAYFFNVHLYLGGFAYFSAYSECIKVGDKGRDRRKPDVAKIEIISKLMHTLSNKPRYVHDDHTFNMWLLFGGTAYVSIDYCEDKMKHWLKPRWCLKTPFSTHIDSLIVAKFAKNRSIPKDTRNNVKERDGYFCLKCGNTEDITMHHITPFSRGGMTEFGNLMILCKKCNQEQGNKNDTNFYHVARLPHSIDLGLLKVSKAGLNDRSLLALLRISEDMMYSRAEIY